MASQHDLSSLESLLISQLENLYDAEKRLVEGLPRVRDAAQAVALKQLFDAHFAQTLKHVERLDEVFSRLNHTAKQTVGDSAGAAVKELLEVPLSGNPDVRDAALIAAAQRIEHYEIAGYGTARTFALELQQPEIAELLQRTLQEEAAADKRLTEVAEIEVNARAAR